MEIVLSCNYKDIDQLQVLLVFITSEVTRMPNYESITLREDLHIRKIYSIHYFEYMKDYVYDGESHDFGEFVFVDSELSLESKKAAQLTNSPLFFISEMFFATSRIKKKGHSTCDLFVCIILYDSCFFVNPVPFVCSRSPGMKYPAVYR